MSIAELRPYKPLLERAESAQGLKTQYQRRLRQCASDAQEIVSCATLVANMVEEAAAKGGRLSIQPQMNFLVGALQRLTKDWAVAESLQNLHPRVSGK